MSDSVICVESQERVWRDNCEMKIRQRQGFCESWILPIELISAR